MKKNNTIMYILFSFILFCLIFIVIYWKTNIYKNIKIKTFFSFLSVIALMFTVLAISIQSFSYIETLNSNNTTAYNNLSNNFFDDIYETFLSNQDMNYFYQDLLDIKHINKNDINRNVIKEQQIAFIILNKSIPIIYYIIENHYDSYKTIGLQSRFNHTFHTFFKSNTFKEYWKDYEEKIAGDPPRIYFKKEFNIKSTHWVDPSLEPEYEPSHNFE